MARRVTWTQEALDDLGSIAEYIRRDSMHYARVVTGNIRLMAHKAAEFPEAGRVAPEFRQAAVRERFIYSYRLVYRNEGDEILVLAVVHGKRLLESLEDRFGET